MDLRRDRSDVTPYQLDRALTMFIQSGWHYDDGDAQAGGGCSSETDTATDNICSADNADERTYSSAGVRAVSSDAEQASGLSLANPTGPAPAASPGIGPKAVVSWGRASRARSRRGGANMARLQGPRRSESCWRNRFTQEVSSTPPWTYRAVLEVGTDSSIRKASAWRWMPRPWQLKQGAPEHGGDPARTYTKRLAFISAHLAVFCKTLIIAQTLQRRSGKIVVHCAPIHDRLPPVLWAVAAHTQPASPLRRSCMPV